MKKKTLLNKIAKRYHKTNWRNRPALNGPSLWAFIGRDTAYLLSSNGVTIEEIVQHIRTWKPEMDLRERVLTIIAETAFSRMDFFSKLGFYTNGKKQTRQDSGQVFKR